MAAAGLRLAAVLLLFGLSCSKKHGFQPTDPLGIANKWVYDSMQLYYYWNKDLPAQPPYQLPTEEFFKKLLSAKDRFSWLYNGQLSTYPKSAAELFGFHYALVPHPFQAGRLTGIVTMVIPGSRAYLVGLERGMFFTKVNEADINAAAPAETAKRVVEGSTVTLQLASFDRDQTSLADSAVVVIPQGPVPQQSVFAARHFVRNGIRTGYLAYYLCNEYDDGSLLQAVGKLQEAAIAELIIDLRYNPGGSVASATKLAAMLAPAFNPDALFITYQGNQHGGKLQQSFAQAIAFSVVPQGRDMNELKALNLGLKRVFILVSQHTASAAELLAHNLRPFLPVILIGGKTLGKDEAAFKIEDRRTPRQVDWVIMPTVYKIADAHGMGNYSDGLLPDYTVDELSQLPLQPLGLPGDRSVDKALQLIYGSTAVQPVELKIKKNGIGSGNIEFIRPSSGGPVIVYR